MIYSVIVKHFNPNVEEEILIEVDNLELTCFVTDWRSDVEIGKSYKANIGITVLDELVLKEQNLNLHNHFSQIDDSFAYFIQGKLDLDTCTIDAGLLIKLDEDEFDLCDFAYLDGKNVELRADRITLEFSKE